MARVHIILLFVVLASVFAKPADEEKKDRTIDNELSDKDHYEEDGGHNSDYDHEAFLGDEAKSFDQLTPEESRERLGIIYDKIDTDKDGQVTQDELKAWIQYTQKKYLMDDVDRQWKSHNPNGKESIDWESYKKMVYGFMDDLDPSELQDNDNDGLSYKDMLRRDQRRWSIADQDQDGSLNREEFANFLHPEEAGHMRDIVVVETMEDIDKDGDGKISIKEYIADMYRGGLEDDGEGAEEPEWVRNEREQFSSFRDKDKDGFLDTEEVKQWIIPADFDHAEAEARHLLFESDTNSDQTLTKEEVLSKYDLFVGSQATDFGEALARHDEF